MIWFELGNTNTIGYISHNLQLDNINPACLNLRDVAHKTLTFHKCRSMTKKIEEHDFKNRGGATRGPNAARVNI